ncbi:hypothetical protein [uncultured Alsobacter sp.]|uniref:hypothetical protein n=1 Tax=uncultured Alsobacter sp. TaxID=1748258 RepID=UPI0025EC879F|nr:hypothetical protein [uncultured Alsobacter sp.]
MTIKTFLMWLPVLAASFILWLVLLVLYRWATASIGAYLRKTFAWLPDTDDDDRLFRLNPRRDVGELGLLLCYMITLGVVATAMPGWLK